MNNQAGDNNHQNPPPPYEIAIGSNAAARSGTTQRAGNLGPFPSFSNAAYHPQTVNPTLAPPFTAQHPEMHTVIPVVTGVPVFGPHPCSMTCPNCNKAIVTVIHARAGLLTFIVCGVLLLFGCWAGCCLVPFCVEDFLDMDHVCPNCGALLGTYKRI